MKAFINNVTFSINENIFLKDPNSSDLGKKIITGSIELINEIGFEGFNFKKLSNKIESTEASIYRYFENKHKLLVYLVSWYWRWIEYKLVFGIHNIESPEDKLSIAVKILTEEVREDSDFSHINEVKLNTIIISNAAKIFFVKEVEQENKEGFFLPYKDLVARVSEVILQANPNFEYPHMLVSSVIEGAHHQRFFAAHLPKLTDQVEGKDAIVEFYTKMVLKTIK